MRCSSRISAYRREPSSHDAAKPRIASHSQQRARQRASVDCGWTQRHSNSTFRQSRRALVRTGGAHSNKDNKPLCQIAKLRRSGNSGLQSVRGAAAANIGASTLGSRLRRLEYVARHHRRRGAGRLCCGPRGITGPRRPSVSAYRAQRCITLRSSGPPTAWRAGQQALGLRPILRLLAINSNVRRLDVSKLLIGITLIALAAVLAFYGTQLARDGWTKVFASTTAAATRPYVVFATTELTLPVDSSKTIQVLFDLKNTGQVEAAGSLRDFTYYFSTNPSQREFAYQSSEAVSFSLSPAEQWRGHFFPPFVLTAEKLAALTSGTARLFVYAKGEYRDPAGKMYGLPFARVYHPSVAGHLAMPPDNVVFK